MIPRADFNATPFKARPEEPSVWTLGKHTTFCMMLWWLVRDLNLNYDVSFLWIQRRGARRKGFWLRPRSMSCCRLLPGLELQPQTFIVDIHQHGSTKEVDTRPSLSVLSLTPRARLAGCFREFKYIHCAITYANNINVISLPMTLESC